MSPRKILLLITDLTIGGTPTVVASGFTTVIDVAFDLPRNAAYVLEHDSDGIIPTTGPGLDGRLVRINVLTGAQTVVASTGLVKPGGMAIGSDGALRVTLRARLPRNRHSLR